METVRVVRVLSTLVMVVVIMAMAMLSTARAQEPKQLVATAAGLYVPLEIDNIQDEILTGVYDESGVVGASLDRLQGPTLTLSERFGYWEGIATKEPRQIVSAYKGVVVVDEAGLAFHGRPGVNLIMRQNFSSMWLETKSIRPLGSDHIAFLLGRDTFGTFSVYLNQFEEREDPKLWSFGEEGNKAPMTALEVIGDKLFVAIPEGVMSIDMSNRDEPEFIGLVMDIDFTGLERIAHLESIDDGAKKYLVASDGIKIWVVDPDTLAVLSFRNNLDPPIISAMRGNGRQLVTVTPHSVFVYEFDEKTKELTELPEVRLPGIGYFEAEVNRYGYLVTSHVANGLQVWKIGRPAVIPPPAPTPNSSLTSHVFLPWLSQPIFRVDDSQKPFASQSVDRQAWPNGFNRGLRLRPVPWPGAPTTDRLTR